MHHRRNGYVRNGRVSGRSGTGAGRVVPVEWIPAGIWWDDGEFWWDDGHTTKTDGVMGGTGERDTCGTCVGDGMAGMAGMVTVNPGGTDAAETGVGGTGAVWNGRGWNNGCQQNGCRRNRWGDGNERYM